VPDGCRDRRHRPKQRRLIGKHRDIADALAAIGDHHRQIAQT
jgi:hypothetical protein